MAAIAWVVFNVSLNYGGQVTGLFYTGAKSPLPSELDRGHTRRIPYDNTGYDAQFYHLMAHDPLLRRGYLAFVDDPRLRWRRIGVPGLAALLTAGSDRMVDFAYLAIELGFAFLGTYWLARYAERFGRHPAWGLAFLAIPATAVSLDRMTIDLPLAALAIGMAWYGTRRAVYVILCAAPLIRETGLVLLAAWCVWRVMQKQWRAAGLGALCAAPFLAWWVYVDRHTPVDAVATWTARYPFSGAVEQTMLTLREAVMQAGLASKLEVAAMAGVWLAFVLAGVLAIHFLARHVAVQQRWEFPELAAILFTLFAASIGNHEIWASAYATGRTMSPLFVVLGLAGIHRGRWVYGLPILLVMPRIALQYAAEIKLALAG